jgi:multiple sugar transport system substrate-binding protein
VPAAYALGSYDGELYALCNGLDIRALYYDQTVLGEHGLSPPTTIAELDRLATTFAPPGEAPYRRFGYLPDPRRLWAWGTVFGGSFYDVATGQATPDDPRIEQALRWMASYSARYGADQVAAFRKGDQALAGAAFPLLEGRYVAIMDGQWRVAEIAAHGRALRERGETPHEFGVAPLPAPPSGKSNAGWVNGNFFIVPRGAKNRAGAWRFMKFWSGYRGAEAEAARACAAGGWIPASESVVSEPAFQEYLARYPMFQEFVRLAASPHQAPTPSIPVASLYYREVVSAAEAAMYANEDPAEVLRAAARGVNARLAEVRDEP